MRILVTGGSGFIGSHVVDLLAARGDAVCNYDIVPPRFVRHAPSWREGDVRDEAELRACLDEFAPDAVLHLAAMAELTATRWEDYDAIHRGTESLLAAIDAHGGVERFANVSTQLVIGPGYAPRSLLDFEPYTLYGEAKAYAEAAVLQWQSPTSWLTIRPATIWGPFHPSLATAIWKYIQTGSYLHPTGAPVLRTYGYVRNTAAQMIALLDADPKITNRQIYYAGDAVMDSATWVDAFAKAIRGRPARRIPVNALKLLGKGGDVARKLKLPAPIDSGRAQRMTESYPVPLDAMFAIAGPPPVAFADGVAESVGWLGAGAPRQAA